MNHRKTSAFLELPVEIRNRIYDFAIPVQHLKAQQFVDACWKAPQGPNRIPSLFFVNKTVSEEATLAFYSRAILNVAPLRPPAYLFANLNTSVAWLNLAFGLDITFASWPRRHLRRISTCHIYSGQTDAINAEAYEALLRWLIDNTSVRTIHLSWRLMTRLRKARTELNAAYSLCLASSGMSLARAIYVFTEHPRSQWELTRMSELRRALKGRELPKVQSYVFDRNGLPDVLLDPRWDARNSDDEERFAMLDVVAARIDALLAADPLYQDMDRPSVPAGHSLYQICFTLQGLQADGDLQSTSVRQETGSE